MESKVELAVPSASEAKVVTAERTLDNLAHVQKLANAMAPDPREWTYEGDVADGGPMARCTCGHPIRYVYTIVRTRDGGTLPIGSVCIDSTVPYLMAAGADHLVEALRAAQERHKRALAEAAKKVRDAAASEVVQALLAEWTALREWAIRAVDAEEQEARNVAATWGYRDRRYQEAVDRAGAARRLAGLLRRQPKAGSTPGRTAASLRGKLAKAYMEVFATGFAVTGPAEPGLREKIAREYERVVERAEWEAAEAPKYGDPAYTAKTAARADRARERSALMPRRLGA